VEQTLILPHFSPVFDPPALLTAPAGALRFINIAVRLLKHQSEKNVAWAWAPSLGGRLPPYRCRRCLHIVMHLCNCHVLFLEIGRF
jgi:hypothetical protein